ncbi:hypothetical protein HW452_05240 [Halomonas aquamarina]|uniref:Uncharacterized protein n=1 Tax=Vreelandella aquamarina TaxID=77097 RepID=A0ACC5VRM8_9GAMM|nr:hypothetical protein [Halomonas aquamarina]MBZ5486926.1 hypothetical protein [Halomonas aquamarina]
MITNDARLAWVMARDDGLRSQGVISIEMAELGCMVDCSAKGGVGAGMNADYAAVHAAIQAMDLPRQAVGDALNCRGVLNARALAQANTMAALAVSQIAAQRLPGFSKWSSDRQRMLYWVALAAVERCWVVLHDVPERMDAKARPEGRTLDEPWKIGKWLRGMHGKALDLKNWAPQWSKAWELLQIIVNELDDGGQVEVEEILGIKRRLQKAS